MDDVDDVDDVDDGDNLEDIDVDSIIVYDVRPGYKGFETNPLHLSDQRLWSG